MAPLSKITGLILWALLLPSTLSMHIERRAVDGQVAAYLQYFAQFSAAAYCEANHNNPSGGTKLTCPGSGNCPWVEGEDVQTIYEFENSRKTDVTGYVATVARRKMIVIAFRGSNSIRNYITDIGGLPEYAPELCPGCRVHPGFYESWQESKDGILAVLYKAQSTHPGYKIVVTGHSLGGAIAAIAALELRNHGMIVDLYTYGQPRIGGEAISSYITNQNKGATYRVTHGDDPIPNFPPTFSGYRHISPEYYIDTDNEETVYASDITLLTGTYNRAGNTGRHSLIPDFPAHSFYFGPMSKCAAGGLLPGWKE